MQITKNELKQIIEEELAAVAESAWRAGGQELNRIRLNTANEVAIALANLAEDLQDMGYGPEAMQLRSWAEANDFLYNPSEEELVEGEVEEGLLDTVRGMLNPNKDPKQSKTADEYSAAAFLRTLDPNTRREAGDVEHNPEYAKRFASKLEEDELEESDGPRHPEYYRWKREQEAAEKAAKERQVGSVGSGATVSPQRGYRDRPAWNPKYHGGKN
jgi:hypothetical protein